MKVLIVINVLCVFWSMSGLDRPLRKLIWDWLYKGLPFNDAFLVKPLGCSWCLATWLGLGSLLFLEWHWWLIIAALVMAFFNSLIVDVLHLVKDIIGGVINWLYDHLVIN